LKPSEGFLHLFPIRIFPKIIPDSPEQIVTELVVVFAPNRLYPFETHGAYFGKRYVFGNIPFVGYLPDGLRDKFAPHVRAYRSRDLRALFDGLDGEIIAHTQVYPGYDKIAARRKELAGVFRNVTYALENTPLRNFGLSHFLVWRKK